MTDRLNIIHLHDRDAERWFAPFGDHTARFGLGRVAASRRLARFRSDHAYTP